MHSIIMELLLDVQGFCGVFNEFIVKELAYTSITESYNSGYGNESRPHSIFFKSPDDFYKLLLQKSQTNLWLQRNYHGIPCSYGTVEYDQVDKILNQQMQNASRIYVKGRQKKEWLEKYCTPDLSPIIMDLDECFEDCPSISTFKNLPSSLDCPFHCNLQRKVCAVKNVTLLEEWLARKKRKNVGSTDRSIRLYYELGNLKLMNPEDIAQLPYSFISNYATRDVEGSWEKVTKEMQSDYEIMTSRYCYVHYNLSDGDCIDGPPLMRKNCMMFKA